jgi:hypothetical protein
MVEKKLFPQVLIETTATEESPVSSGRGKILRRPEIWCHLTDGVVGLLRMTSAAQWFKVTWMQKIGELKTGV